MPRTVHVNSSGTAARPRVDSSYVCISDIVNADEIDLLVSSWLGNSITLNILSQWEIANNNAFDLVEYSAIRRVTDSGLAIITLKNWLAKTKAVGLKIRRGTPPRIVAHPDIAFHFGMWLTAYARDNAHARNKRPLSAS